VYTAAACRGDPGSDQEDEPVSPAARPRLALPCRCGTGAGRNRLAARVIHARRCVHPSARTAPRGA